MRHDTHEEHGRGRSARGAACVLGHGPGRDGAEREATPGFTNAQVGAQVGVQVSEQASEQIAEQIRFVGLEAFIGREELVTLRPDASGGTDTAFSGGVVGFGVQAFGWVLGASIFPVARRDAEPIETILFACDPGANTTVTNTTVTNTTGADTTGADTTEPLTAGERTASVKAALPTQSATKDTTEIAAEVHKAHALAHAAPAASADSAGHAPQRTPQHADGFASEHDPLDGSSGTRHDPPGPWEREPDPIAAGSVKRSRRFRCPQAGDTRGIRYRAGA